MDQTITIRNQGSIRVKIQPSGVLLVTLTGNEAATIILTPDKAQELIDTLGTALLYFNAPKVENVKTS